ncbi:MAG: peptide-methionine (S)-S-oxide reductase [Sphingomonadaceae bacterium]
MSKEIAARRCQCLSCADGKSGKWDRPIVTGIESYRTFYKAEDYHQDFMLKNPRHRYILTWDAPKVKALKWLYPGIYRLTFQRD